MNKPADASLQIENLTNELAATRGTLTQSLATLASTNAAVTGLLGTLKAQKELVAFLLARLSKTEFEALPADVRAVAARFRTVH
jgi:hypothetical protein